MPHPTKALLAIALIALMPGCNTGATTTPASASPRPSGASPAPTASTPATTTPTAGGDMADSTVFKVDGVDVGLARDFFFSGPSRRGSTYSMGNQSANSTEGAYRMDVRLNAANGEPLATQADGASSVTGEITQLTLNVRQGNAQIAQSYVWDGAPELQAVTVASGKATFSFKGKMKRNYGSQPPEAMTIEGNVTGLPLR